MSTNIVNQVNVIKILLIEDDFMHRGHFQRLIDKQNSYQSLDIVKSGFAALIVLKKNKEINLVVTDYALGKTGLWGNDLAKEIKEDYPGIKILFWSGYFADQDHEAAKLSGADGYVAKHVEDNALLEAIDKIMGGETSWSPKSETENLLTPAQEKIVKEFIRDGKANPDKKIADTLLKDELKVEKAHESLKDFIAKSFTNKTKLIASHFRASFTRTKTANRAELFFWAIMKFADLRMRLGFPKLSDYETAISISFIKTGSIEETAKEYKISNVGVRDIIKKFGTEVSDQDIQVLGSFIKKESIKETTKECNISETDLRDILKKFGINNIEAETELKKDDDDREG